VIMQWVSAGFGGYFAGRLRTRWASLHTDESYFRDTAHGVLAWAVAAVVTAALLAGAASVLTGGAVMGTATVASGAAQNSGASSSTTYFVDTMFRSDHPDASATGQDPRPEAIRIVTAGLRPGAKVSDADRTYLAKVVAARTGISQEEAQSRVDAAINDARQAADAARKATMKFSLIVGFTMLVGAFIAAVSAKIGGHHRDDLIVE
jgi:hypothetical protein